MNSLIRTGAISVLAVVTAAIILVDSSGMAFGHGERNQEPFLRMRTFHWYDIKFSRPGGSEIPVNEEIEISGKFRIFKNWPDQINRPDLIYMNTASAGAVFVKLEAWVNDQPAIQSFKGEPGRDYAFRVKMKARWEGRWHLHPMINVKSAGGLLGPGQWYTITGSHKDFTLSAKTLTGVEIANLETWGVSRVVTWHGIWIIVAIAWLLWWIRRPLFIPRWLMVIDENCEDELVTGADRRMALVLLTFTLAASIAAYIVTENNYPRTITLQAGRAHIDPMPVQPSVPVRMKAGEYFIPGRTIVASFKVTNTADKPIRLGEFTSASLRFIDKSVPAAAASIANSSYPDELIANEPLKINNNSPLAPGKTRTITIEATDAAWETERLSALLNGPESTLGALLFFYDTDGKRYISELYGTLIPIFQR